MTNAACLAATLLEADDLELHSLANGTTALVALTTTASGGCGGTLRLTLSRDDLLALADALDAARETATDDDTHTLADDLGQLCRETAERSWS